MPIYEFKCKTCGREFDELCSFSEIENVRCPECSTSHPHRLLSKVAFIGDGSGRACDLGDVCRAANGEGNGFDGSTACNSCASRSRGN